MAIEMAIETAMRFGELESEPAVVAVVSPVAVVGPCPSKPPAPGFGVRSLTRLYFFVPAVAAASIRLAVRAV